MEVIVDFIAGRSEIPLREWETLREPGVTPPLSLCDSERACIMHHVYYIKTVKGVWGVGARAALDGFCPVAVHLNQQHALRKQAEEGLATG